MNILFLLIPKATCAYVNEDFTIRQALEKMSVSGFAALPILARDGTYRGTITEGDLLWAIKDLFLMDMKEAERHSIMDIRHKRDNIAVSVNTRVEDLLTTAVDQNFVPVVDDRHTFIGIITRKAIMQYCIDRYFPKAGGNGAKAE